jgi:hypothetical protein
MLSADKINLLQSFLGGLPAHLAHRLAKAVEVDRLAEGKLLPHDLILSGLRPVLREPPQAERTLTPLRLFCLPFEDLLSSEPRREKRKGRIARESIIPVWKWLNENLLPDAAQAYTRDTRDAILAIRFDDARAHATEFWSASSAAIRSALATERDRMAAEATLGKLIVADAEEMALLLAAGPQIVEIQEKLPRPAPSMNDDLVWALRGIYDGLVHSVPDAAPYVAVIAMSRLARPWEALKLPLQISRSSQDTLIASTDMGLAGELLLDDIALYADAIRAIRQPWFNGNDVLANVSRFAVLSSAVVKEIEIRRDGRWGQRLMKDRATVAEAMKKIMEKSPDEILAALPMHKSGAYGAGPRVPDIARAPDPEKIERAMRYAKLLVGCLTSASAASFGAAQKDATEEVERELQVYGDEIVKEIRAAEGETRARAEQYLSITADLYAIFFSDAEAELMKRRARAALAA